MVTSPGVVFTPPVWARWALEKLDVLSLWENGASVCDPTAGEGVFSLSLVRMLKEKRGSIDPQLLDRLFLVEKESRFLETFQKIFRDEFHLEFPSANLVCTDVVTFPPNRSFDVLVGNPPWVNFSDLEPALKEVLRPFFLDLGLVDRRRDVLLGASRVDLAALVLTSVFVNNAHPATRCGFFLPASLFHNDGAHQGLRRWRFRNTEVKIDRIFDFPKESVFSGVSTRFCFVEFTVGKPASYPVEYWVQGPGGWSEFHAAPVGGEGSPLTVKPLAETDFSPPQITLQRWQRPRQGINTCGATSVFVFSEFPDFLNPDFVYPLVTTRFLKGLATTPEKFILVPYNRDGKVLTEEAMKAAGLLSYLEPHREQLENRRGVRIRAAMKSGAWWSLLGVGPYSFAACKVVWSAFGKSSFEPRVVSSWGESPWQANQAMQAFIPSHNNTDAQRICRSLVDLDIEAHLRDQRMAGSCNWAQPGRILRFLNLEDQ